MFCIALLLAWLFFAMWVFRPKAVVIHSLSPVDEPNSTDLLIDRLDQELGA